MYNYHGSKGLVTNYGEGGYKTGGGGHVKFYPYEKGGGGKSLSHSKGGAQKVLGLFLRSFSHIVGRACKVSTL